MSKPITFPEQNVVFVAPNCGDLPAFQDGSHIVTCWELDEKEKAEILKSGKIYLMVTGKGIPPISIHPFSPFQNASESTQSDPHG